MRRANLILGLLIIIVFILLPIGGIFFGRAYEFVAWEYIAMYIPIGIVEIFLSVGLSIAWNAK